MTAAMRRVVVLALVLAHLGALWPAVLWYVERSTHDGATLWGLAALAGAAAVVLFRPAQSPDRPRLTLATGLLLASAVAALHLPPLLAAAVGVLSLTALVSELRWGRRLDAPLLGLALLALPDVSTLQYFVGWPLRVGVTRAVAWLLRFSGFEATPQGTLVLLEGRAIAVDAPCSGIWMGWGALLVWLVLAGLRDLDPRRTLLGLLLLGPTVFVANTLRSFSLTFVEAHGSLPPWVHDGVGLIVFAGLAAAVVLGSERLAPTPPGRVPCAA